MFQDNIHLVFGTSMHDTLQLYFRTHLEKGIDEANSLDLRSILKERLKSVFKESQEKYDKPPCTIDEIKEAYLDGVEIINYIKENPLDITLGNTYEFIGVEYPIRVHLNPHILFTGNLDFVFKDTKTDIIYIKDFKTSTRGWDKWQLDDKTKTQQLLLYKKFYSDVHKIPLEKIHIEYIILKRKVELPDQPRIQLFTPKESAGIIMNLIKNVDTFVSSCFKDANFNTDKVYAKTATNKACMFCDYNNTEHCDAPNFKYNKD